MTSVKDMNPVTHSPSQIVDKLADEASAAVPKVKRIGTYFPIKLHFFGVGLKGVAVSYHIRFPGDTTNLEKRIKDAKGSFGAVKPPPSIGK